MTCPVCGSSSSSEFLSREQVPVHQNLLMHDQAAAIEILRGNLALVVCHECGFIFNRAFQPHDVMYGEDYENTQTCSPSFNAYLDGLVRHMIVDRGVRDCHVVEVGCGNGAFLRKLVAYDGSGNRGDGWDPSYRGPDSDLNGRSTFSTRYYDSDCADVPADVIVCRHVIEHVPRPLQLLETFERALARAPHARIFIETPCVEWILANFVVWDFFYEHCSYFSAASLSQACQAAGLEVRSVRYVFEGQYLWLEATLPTSRRRLDKTPGSMLAQAQRFARAEASLKEDWGRNIRALSETHKVAVWGAGAKGVTFANLIDPARQWLDCVVDLNPSKQGSYVAGTGHPIVGYQALRARGVSSAIVMNPNYLEENRALLRAAHLDIRLFEPRCTGTSK